MLLRTKDMTVDIDRVSFVHETEQMIVVDGQGLHLRHGDDFKAVKKAFEWSHKDVTYNENLKKMGGDY